MKEIILIWIMIFVSFPILADEENANVSLPRNNFSIGSENSLYVLQNGELKVLVPKYDVTEKSFAPDLNRHFMGTKEMRQQLSALKKDIANDICKNKFRPDSVTITVFFVSATWGIENFCKNEN